MSIKEVLATSCNEGDVLASDLLNSCGVTLVAKDTVLNDYIIKKLIDLGIKSVYISNSSKDTTISCDRFKNAYRDNVIQTKEVLHRLIEGEPLDYIKVTNICNQIYRNINFDYNISRCMTQIHSTDEYTYTHCVNTAFYAMFIAKWLDLPDYEINNVIQSGLLHDIGKIKIPSKILRKSEILTKEEFEVIKNHTTLGYRLVEDIDDISFDIKRAILLHHERIDGSGYPFRMQFNDINLYAKIVAVADVFDAMTSDRPYKDRVSPFKAFEMFQTVGVGIFDTKVLRVFLKNLAAYLVGTKVLLNSGETGEVVYVPLQNLSCPVIKVSSGYLDISQQDTIRISSII